MPTVWQDEKLSTRSQAIPSVLDLSGQQLDRIDPLPEGISPQTLILENNDISRIENLQYFAHLQQLSLACNRLTHMNGINLAQGLKVLDLSNNAIQAIEGLNFLRGLEWLNLSGNAIKKIENLNKNANLVHLDLSENSIMMLSDLTALTKLKTLLLHGNLLTSLQSCGVQLPPSVHTFSLAGNEIRDLNEVAFLLSLPNLEQLSIANNPCSQFNTKSVDFTPFVVCCCPRIRNLDGHLISQDERLKAELLKREDQLRFFTPGQHRQLSLYLSQVNYLDTSLKLQTAEKRRLRSRGKSTRPMTAVVEGYFDKDPRYMYEEENHKRWSMPVDQYTQLINQQQGNNLESRYTPQEFGYSDMGLSRPSSCGHDGRVPAHEATSFHNVKAHHFQQETKRHSLPLMEMVPDGCYVNRERYPDTGSQRLSVHDTSGYHGTQSKLYSNDENTMWSTQVVGRASRSNNAGDLTLEEIQSLAGEEDDEEQLESESISLPISSTSPLSLLEDRDYRVSASTQNAISLPQSFVAKGENGNQNYLRNDSDDAVNGHARYIYASSGEQLKRFVTTRETEDNSAKISHSISTYDVAGNRGLGSHVDPGWQPESANEDRTVRTVERVAPDQRLVIGGNSNIFPGENASRIPHLDGFVNETKLEGAAHEAFLKERSRSANFNSADGKQLIQSEVEDNVATRVDNLCSATDSSSTLTPLSNVTSSETLVPDEDGDICASDNGRNAEAFEFYEDDVDGKSAPVMTEKEAFELINLAATIIQACVRGFLVRKKLDLWDLRRRNQAAAVIQASWKGYHARIYDIRVVSARQKLKVQRLSAYVKHIAGLFQRYRQENDEEKQKMLEVIQVIWMENHRHAVKEQTKAAVIIQSHWRAYCVRKVHQQFKRKTKAHTKNLAVFCHQLQNQIKLLAEQVRALSPVPEHRFSPVRRQSPKFRRRAGSGDTMESDTTESETSVVEPCGRRKNTIDDFLEGEGGVEAKAESLSGDDRDIPNRQQEQGKVLVVKSPPDIMITSPSDRSSFSSEGSSFSDFKYGGSENTKFKALVKFPEKQEQDSCDTQFTSTVSKGTEDSPHVSQVVSKEEIKDWNVIPEANATEDALNKTETNTDDEDVTDKMSGYPEMVVTSSELSTTSDDEKRTARSSVVEKPVVLLASSASELDLFERTEAVLNDPDLSNASTVAVCILSSNQLKLPENKKENVKKEKNTELLQEISITHSYEEQEREDMGRMKQRISLDEIAEGAIVRAVNRSPISTAADDKGKFVQTKSAATQPVSYSKQADKSTVSFSFDSSEESDCLETVGSVELNPSISHSNSFPSCILSQIKERDMARSHSLDSLKGLQSASSKKGGDRFKSLGKYSVSPWSGSPLGNKAAALLSELQSQISSVLPHRRSELETDNIAVRRYSDPSAKAKAYYQSGVDVTQATVSCYDENTNSQETSTDQTFHQGSALETDNIAVHRYSDPSAKTKAYCQSGVDFTQAIVSHNGENTNSQEMSADQTFYKGVRNDDAEIPVLMSSGASVDSIALDSNNNDELEAEVGSNPMNADENEPSKNSSLELMNENGTSPPSLFEGRSQFIEDNAAVESTEQSQLASLELNSAQSCANEVSPLVTLPAKGEGFSMPLFEDLERTSFSMDDSLDFQKNSNDDQDD